MSEKESDLIDRKIFFLEKVGTIRNLFGEMMHLL